MKTDVLGRSERERGREKNRVAQCFTKDGVGVPVVEQGKRCVANSKRSPFGTNKGREEISTNGLLMCCVWEFETAFLSLVSIATKKR